MKDQATPERLADSSSLPTRIRCGIIFVSIIHSVLMRVVSKVNTLTVGGWDLASVGDSVAVSDKQASEPEAGFCTAQPSYGTDLSAAVPSTESNV